MTDDYLNRMIEKANTSFWDTPGAKAARELSKHSVRHDSFDEFGWKLMLDQMGFVRDQVNYMHEDFPTSPPAMEDIFNLLNQGDPRFTSMDDMENPYKPQRMLLEGLSDSDIFKTLRGETRYDEYNTAFAMLGMKDMIHKAFEDLQDAIDAANAMTEAIAQALANAIEARATGQGQQAAGEALEKALADGEAAKGATEEAAADGAQSLQDAAQDAVDQIEKEKESFNAYGVEDGQLKKMDFETRRRLVRRLDQDKMRKLAKLVGAFRNFADAERRRRVKYAPSEVYDVEMGNDLTLLVPSEIDSLAVPELEDLFWLRHVQHANLQYKVRGSNRAGQGPIIVVCDESGSMGCPLDGDGNTREAWSKAVALALADQARRDKRDFIYIGFASDGQVWEKHFPGGNMDVDGLIEFTEHFFNGGTSYERPLTRAMAIVRDYWDRGRPTPDVVFITDDQCRVDDSFIETFRAARELVSMKVYGIEIGGSGYANNLKDLADRLMTIDALTASPEGVQDLFREI